MFEMSKWPEPLGLVNRLLWGDYCARHQRDSFGLRKGVVGVLELDMCVCRGRALEREHQSERENTNVSPLMFLS